jgi:5-methyltetrahydropteroyltriglutamate--homocysteine methyltransferase
MATTESVSTQSGPPFRADHVGSLRRPDRLMRARENLLGVHDLDRNFGPHQNSELRALEDECIREVVKLQEDTGIQSITDGEFRRRIWWSDFLLSLQGVSGNYRGAVAMQDSSGHRVPVPRIEVSAPIRWTRSINVEPFKFLKSVTRRTPKVTIPAPQTLYHFASRDTIDPKVYPDLQAVWSDLAKAYALELWALAEAGCSYVQFDEVVSACLCDEMQRNMFRSRGDDPDQVLHSIGKCISDILKGRPEGMTVVMHTCRGNLQGHWLAEGGYDPVAEYVFNEIPVDAYFLEYDSPRAGTFEPLRFVPKNKRIVLGLVSTKTPELESADLLKRRIDEASKYVSLDRLCISPQCGFSSNYLGNPVTIDDEKRKLELVVSVAEFVWSIS